MTQINNSQDKYLAAFTGRYNHNDQKKSANNLEILIWDVNQPELPIERKKGFFDHLTSLQAIEHQNQTYLAATSGSTIHLWEPIGKKHPIFNYSTDDEQDVLQSLIKVKDKIFATGYQPNFLGNVTCIYEWDWNNSLPVKKHKLSDLGANKLKYVNDQFVYLSDTGKIKTYSDKEEFLRQSKYLFGKYWDYTVMDENEHLIVAIDGEINGDISLDFINLDGQLIKSKELDQSGLINVIDNQIYFVPTDMQSKEILRYNSNNNDFEQIGEMEGLAIKLITKNNLYLTSYKDGMYKIHQINPINGKKTEFKSDSESYSWLTVM